MEFEWDDGNRDKSLISHNVHYWEIEEAVADDRSLVVQSRIVEGELRHVLLGRSETSGKYLRVVFTVRIRGGVDYVRAISAVEMTVRERRRYQRT